MFTILQNQLKVGQKFNFKYSIRIVSVEMNYVRHHKIIKKIIVYKLNNNNIYLDPVLNITLIYTYDFFSKMAMVLFMFLPPQVCMN